ncbi:hypothetical protein EB796_022195 [Bugula neritina]|uniref:Uncharacterized protein n=1 Tax=Bugula neritina TaxID=10212 RepID=A0A7J7J009_BUGNE|nr:hypothetical protein EB796_022195 [Bugula neritina]
MMLISFPGAPVVANPDTGETSQDLAGVDVKRITVSAQQIAEAMLYLSHHNIFIKKMVKDRLIWKKRMQAIYNQAKITAAENVQREHPKFLKVMSLTLRVAKSEPGAGSRTQKPSVCLSTTCQHKVPSLSAKSAVSARTGRTLTGCYSPKIKSSQSYNLPSAFGNSPSRYKLNAGGVSKRKFPETNRRTPIKATRNNYTKPMQKQADADRLSGSRDEQFIDDHWKKNPFKNYRRAGFTGNITLIKLRGRNVTHSDLYKPTPSMESILHRSFIRDRLVKPGHVDEIISLSSKTSLPPINQPSTFKTIYNMMNQTTTQAEFLSDKDSRDLILEKFRGRLLSEAAKEKKAITFQSYLQGTAGKAYTQHVYIRKSNNRIYTRGPAKSVQLDDSGENIVTGEDIIAGEEVLEFKSKRTYTQPKILPPPNISSKNLAAFNLNPTLPTSDEFSCQEFKDFLGAFVTQRFW